MKKCLMYMLTALVAISFSLSLSAQDKTVKKIIELGTTDNRTMAHDDHLANVIGGRIVGSAALTEAEAWAMVSKAISRASSYSVQDFEAFPPAVKRAVGSPRQLCEWGLMEIETVQSVVSSNFRRSYAQALTQHREAAALPENVRAQIEGLASRLALEEGGKK